MKIGIDARLPYYRTGGISTYVRRLILALEALDTETSPPDPHSTRGEGGETPQTNE